VTGVAIPRPGKFQSGASWVSPSIAPAGPPWGFPTPSSEPPQPAPPGASLAGPLRRPRPLGPQMCRPAAPPVAAAQQPATRARFLLFLRTPTQPLSSRGPRQPPSRGLTARSPSAKARKMGKGTPGFSTGMPVNGPGPGDPPNHYCLGPEPYMLPSLPPVPRRGPPLGPGNLGAAPTSRPPRRAFRKSCGVPPTPNRGAARPPCG